MNNQSFANRLVSGPPAIGTLVSMASLDAIDVLSNCGYDWFFLDMEHSTLSNGEAKALLQVIAGRAYTLARVAGNEPIEIKKALDIGCEGVIVPSVNSKAEAEQAVRYAKYSPEGDRSVGIGRAHGYGVNFNGYVETANANIAVIVQIEHKLAIENIDDILSVQGIDAVFIGPYDLSGSMNLLGRVADQAVQVAIDHVRSRCAAAGIPYGIFVMTADACLKELEKGASFVAMGVDALHLYNGARSQLQLVNGALNR